MFGLRAEPAADYVAGHAQWSPVADVAGRVRSLVGSYGGRDEVCVLSSLTGAAGPVLTNVIGHSLRKESRGTEGPGRAHVKRKTAERFGAVGQSAAVAAST